MTDSKGAAEYRRRKNVNCTSVHCRAPCVFNSQQLDVSESQNQVIHCPFIYSLRDAHTASFQKCSSTFWLHLGSLLFRCLSGTALITVPMTLNYRHAATAKDALVSDTVRHFVNQLNVAHRVLGLTTGTILLITGLLGAWVLWGVCVGHETEKRSSRYVVETVSLRLALVISILHFALAVCLLSLSYAAFCVPLSLVGTPSATECTRRSGIIVEAVFSGLNVLINAFPLFLWLGKAFRLYTSLSYLRFIFGSVVLALTLQCTVTLRTVQHLPDYASLDQDTAYQIELLQSLTAAHGIFSAAASLLTSLYSIVTAFYRSAVLMGIDVIVVFFAFWSHASLVFAMNWIFAILRYLKDYRDAVGAENSVLEVLLSNKEFKQRYIFICVTESLTLVCLCITFFSAFAFLTLRCWKPLEWTVVQRLTARPAATSHHPSQLKSLQPITDVLQH